MGVKTVLLLGAGVTRAAAGRKSLGKLPPLDRDFFKIAASAHPRECKAVTSRVEALFGSYAQEVLQSLETTSTLLYLKAMDSARNSVPHRTFVNHLSLLSMVLETTTNDLPDGTGTWLYRLIRREATAVPTPQDLSVITFNYDLMIERVLDEMQLHSSRDVFAFPGCYRMDDPTIGTVTGDPGFLSRNSSHLGVSVLKLHGSMNWVSSHTSKSPTPSALFNKKRKLTVLNTTEVITGLTIGSGKSLSHVKPIILPPVTGKRGLLHDDLSQVWNEAALSLSQADRIVIAGYSCPPLDFEARMLIGESVDPDTVRDLVVIDRNPDVAKRFMSLCGVASCQVFTSLKSFLAS